MERGYIEEIDEVIQRVNTHPEYSLCIERRTNEAIRKGAFRHSLELEQQTHRRTRYAQRNTQKYMRFMSEAWDYLSKHGLSLASLSVLGGIVEPLSNPRKSYRTTEVTIGIVPPSSPRRIMHDVKNLLDSLDTSDLHPVTRASEAHLGLAGIHPYEDGNGRVSRLVQNFCLAQRGYPAAIINHEESEEYRKILRDSLQSRYSGESTLFAPSEADNTFRDFIAERILKSVVTLDSELQKRRIYEVSIGNAGDLGSAYSLAEVIRRRTKKHGWGTSVSVKRTDNKKKKKRSIMLEVKGDIGLEDLESVVGDVSKRHGIRSHVKNLKVC